MNVRKLGVVGAIRGQRVKIRMLLARVELYVADVRRVKLLRGVPAVVVLVMAATGVSPLHSVPGVNALDSRSLASLVVVGSMRGKAADLERLNPGISEVGVSWRYVEPVAVVCLAIAGLYLFE